jgi:hypothetical protein
MDISGSSKQSKSLSVSLTKEVRVAFPQTAACAARALRGDTRIEA